MKDNWVSASTVRGLLGTLGSIEEKLPIHSTLHYKYFCQFQFQAIKRLSMGLGIGPQRWLSELELALALTCCQHILLEVGTHAWKPQMQGMQAERKNRSIPVERTVIKHIPFSKRREHARLKLLLMFSTMTSSSLFCNSVPTYAFLPKYHKHFHVLLRIYLAVVWYWVSNWAGPHDDTMSFFPIFFLLIDWLRWALLL